MRPPQCESIKTYLATALHTQDMSSAHSTQIHGTDYFEGHGLRSNEVLLDVLYCGIAHTDVLAARTAPRKTTANPLLGQEIIGRIKARGRSVSRFKLGDIVGVGALAASCGQCSQCLGNLEQYCQNTPVSTRDYQNVRPATHHPARPLQDSNSIVVTEPFLIRIPPDAELAATAPILGAAITTYSAMQHWDLTSGQHVGVIGMGGLGHMAVKLAAARQANVTVFTTSPDKRIDATRFGARETLLWNDEAAFDRLANQFDLLISTVPQPYSILNFMDLLKLNGTLINLGTTEELQDFPGPNMSPGRRSVAGSTGGSIAEIEELLAYCTLHEIRPEIECIRPDRIDHIFDGSHKKNTGYRYVIDFASERKH